MMVPPGPNGGRDATCGISGVMAAAVAGEARRCSPHRSILSAPPCIARSTGKAGCSRCLRSSGASTQPPLTHMHSISPALNCFCFSPPPPPPHHHHLLQACTLPVAGRAVHQTRTNSPPILQTPPPSDNWTLLPSMYTGSGSPSS